MPRSPYVPSLPLPRLLALFLVAALSAPALARWRESRVDTPVERLVTNLTAHVKEHPRDADAHYALGRVHSLAWATDEESVRVDPPKEGSVVPGWPARVSLRVRRTAGDPGPEALRHFHRAVHHYGRAVALDRRAALPRLGLAWMLDSGTSFCHLLETPDGHETKTDVGEEEQARYRKSLEQMATAKEETGRRAARDGLYAALPRAASVMITVIEETKTTAAVREAAVTVLRRHWEDLALAAYRDAWTVALPTDRSAEYLMRGVDIVSQEAGKAILRILDGRVETEALAKEKERIREVLEEFDGIARAITPIVFPVDGNRPLADLLPPGHTARFDLDGDGEPGLWPWVDGKTGFLVWAPARDVSIDSGRRLFGSVTWWMFWESGYEPLAALDDDGDGALTGAELEGIAVWVDSDGDAESGPGEVVPAGTWGIVSIAVRPTARTGEATGRVPAHPRGVALGDGTTLPTYDWTPERLDPAP